MLANRGRREQEVSPALALREQSQPVKPENVAQLTPPPLAKGTKQKGCGIDGVHANVDS